MAFSDFAESPEFGERAQRWADALYFGPPGQQESWPIGPAFGIFGVGLVRRYDKEDYIALLTPPRHGDRELRLDEIELINPESDEDVLKGIQLLLPTENLHRVRILRIPPIVRNAAAGTKVYGAQQGTAGPGVTWAGGRIGFLTAGHVAVGTTHVTDANGANLGKMIHAFDPAVPSSGTAVNVDVAVIETPRGAVTTSFGNGNPMTGSAPIDLHLAVGLTQSTILAMIGWYVWPGLGTYVDLYMTNAACTVPGDSGAVVTSSGSRDAIGMVVGGTKTFASFIQDIHRQISTLKTVTGLGTLSL